MLNTSGMFFFGAGMSMFPNNFPYAFNASSFDEFETMNSSGMLQWNFTKNISIKNEAESQIAEPSGQTPNALFFPTVFIAHRTRLFLLLLCFEQFFAVFSFVLIVNVNGWKGKISKNEKN